MLTMAYSIGHNTKNTVSTYANVLGQYQQNPLEGTIDHRPGRWFFIQQ